MIHRCMHVHVVGLQQSKQSKSISLLIVGEKNSRSGGFVLEDT